MLTDAEMAAQDEQARERVEGLGALQHHLPSGA